MEKILLINADEPEEVRVAVVEDGRLEEVYIEAGSDPTGKGNIYVGRVQNVERGIGAAFVDLGHGVTGFLHASDIAEPPSGSPKLGTRAGRGAEDGSEERDGERGRGRRRRGRGGPRDSRAGSEEAAPAASPGETATETEGAASPSVASLTEVPAGEGDPSSDADGSADASGASTRVEGAELERAERDVVRAPARTESGEAPHEASAEDRESSDTAEEVPPPAPRGRTIMDLVKPGDDILVQISRGPVGHKGPTLTTRISLPGRYVVLLANSTRSGTSRRIETGEERDRMRQLRGRLEVPNGMAVILRTASNGRSYEEVQADLSYLQGLYENMKARLHEGKGPRLVHEESDLVSRAVRDILPPDATRIVTDDAPTAERIREYLRRTHPTRPPVSVAVAESSFSVETVSGTETVSEAPTGDAEDSTSSARNEEVAAAGGSGCLDAADSRREVADVSSSGEDDRPVLASREDAGGGRRPTRESRRAAREASRETAAWRPPPSVEVHPGPTPLLHAFGVEAAIEDAFRRTIRLPSGGSIVIDPTEALVAIDVNSGRLTEEEDLETTALKTDLEAVPEVARQLRMRDLGGVIVIDFIDLRESSHMQQVEQALREALKRDRARIRLGRMGPFGCLELTRQRIRPALLSVTHVLCPTCQGAGRRRHPLGIALRVLRELRARAARSRGHGGLEVRVPPQVAELLRKHKADSLAALEAWLTGPFRLVPDPQIPYGGWALKGLPPRTPTPRPLGPVGGAGAPSGASPAGPTAPPGARGA